MNRVSLTIAGIISSIALSIPVYLVVVFILDQIHEINDQSIPHYAAGTIAVAIVLLSIRYPAFYLDLAKGIVLVPATVVRLDMKVFLWLLKRLKGKRRDHHDT